MTRVDKADILELTVQHLTSEQQHQQIETLDSQATAFNSGYRECMRQTVSYLSSRGLVDTYSIKLLSNHLNAISERAHNFGTIDAAAGAGFQFSTPARACVPGTIIPGNLSAFSPIASVAQYSHSPYLSSTSRTKSRGKALRNGKARVKKSSMDSSEFSSVSSPGTSSATSSSASANQSESCSLTSTFDSAMSRSTDPSSDIPSSSLSANQSVSYSCTSTSDSSVSSSGNQAEDVWVDVVGLEESDSEAGDQVEKDVWRPW